MRTGARKANKTEHDTDYVSRRPNTTGARNAGAVISLAQLSEFLASVDRGRTIVFRPLALGSVFMQACTSGSVSAFAPAQLSLSLPTHDGY